MFDEKFLKKLTILCAEDSKSVRAFMQTNMGKFFKNFYTAKDGKEALARYHILQTKNIKVDAIVSDIHMPILDGIEFLKEIRKIDNKVPFIFTTSYLEKEYLLEAIKLNATEYIIKPIDIESAVSKIERECRFIKQQETIEQQKIELERYLEAIDSVAIISRVNIEEKIVFVNKTLCEVSQYEKEELLGERYRFLIHPDFPEETIQNIWKEIRAGNVWKGKIKCKAKDESVYFENATIFPIFDKTENKIIEYIGIRFLITEEEEQKREFKKRVIQNVKETRILKNEQEKYIKELQNELDNSTTSVSIDLQERLKNKREKISSLNSQIDFYEEELKKMNTKNETIVSTSNEKVKKAFSYVKNIKTENDKLNFDISQAKFNLEEKAKELKRLNEKVIDQEKLIKDLRDVIEHREDQLNRVNDKKI